MIISFSTSCGVAPGQDGDLLTQLAVSATLEAVLHGFQGVARGDLLEGSGQPFHRQQLRGGVGDPQGDDAGLAGDGED